MAFVRNQTNVDLKDVYSRVTEKVIADLENGTRPWLKAWKDTACPSKPLRENGVPYRGINTILLWQQSVAAGYQSPFFMTFNRAREWNAHVRKGEHGHLVVYANRITKTEHTDEGDIERDIPFMKGYTVFNADQIEGLPAIFYRKLDPKFSDDSKRIEHAEAFFKNTGALIREGGNRAFYSPSSDHIQMPPFGAFPDPKQYVATVLHELGHWTQHPSRLNLDFGRKAWGDHGYAMGELLAELNSAFLSADLEIYPEPPEENAAYIGSWLKVLRSDKRAIFAAASHAQRAADLLWSYQPSSKPSPPSPEHP